MVNSGVLESEPVAAGHSRRPRWLLSAPYVTWATVGAGKSTALEPSPESSLRPRRGPCGDAIIGIHPIRRREVPLSTSTSEAVTASKTINRVAILFAGGPAPAANAVIS